MKANDLNKVMIVNSLLWATALLASALVLRGSGLFEQLFLILIGLWFASSLMLQNSERPIREEWACVRRFLGGTQNR